ncbi:MAG: hypothetical protein J6T01_01920 [Kiritimatiellae bacterium]|nr:hypothetical protein [Kiritimatiellia bacterium]
MKHLIFALLIAASAASASAEGDDNVAVLVSTKGPDRYQDGTQVLNNECYALVWSKDGVFEGFTADGAPIDTNDCVVNVGAVAKNGRCRAAFELAASRVKELAGGVYAVYLLDTRVDAGGTVAPRGLVNGRLAVLNGYGEVADGVSIGSGDGVAVVGETRNSKSSAGKRVNTAAAPAGGVRQPKVKKIVPEGDSIVIYIENLQGYMRVQKGKDLSLSDGVTPAVSADGSSRDVRIAIPKTGDSGFYKVIRN